MHTETEVTQKKRGRGAVIFFIVALGIALAVGGYFGVSLYLKGQHSASSPQQPVQEIPKAVEHKVAEAKLVPGGSAADNEPFFAKVTQDYVAGGGSFDGVSIVNAYVAAGFNKAHMQITPDKTRVLHNAADSIFFAVRYGDSCLMSQFVPGDRSFVVKREPSVAPEKNVCIIGKTRPIDW
ncbi:MAG: hypothetical protein Q4C71_03015 [Microbacteriaceae bacterium]|nr:hypothetical protein [Microbacteriaceae bacterium]